MRKKIPLLLTVLIILACLISASSAQELGGYVPFPIDLSYLADNPPIEKSNSPIPILKASTIPAAYDLRNVSGKSYVTSVKNQNPYGSCWAFASIGAMESNYLKQNLGTDIDLSEMHLAWYTFKNSTSSKAFTLNNSGSDILDQGGHAFYPAALYGRLDGPTYESALAYPTNQTSYTKPSAGTPESYTRALRLRDVFYLNFSGSTEQITSTNRNIIKQRIMNNGAVMASYYNTDSAYYKSSSGTCFYTTSSGTTNHAILIVGWDDNFSKSNFKTQPSSNGAWLIRNSWGTSWGDSGYFWMSYEQYLTGGAAFIVEEANDDMKAYYYDALGWSGASKGYSDTKVYAANVFKSERSGEVLTEVAFYTPDNNLDYEINIYTGMSSLPSSPINGTLVSEAKTTGSEAYAGYHTVTLANPVSLTNGQYFSVILKFTGTGLFPLETKKSGFSYNASIEKGVSFLSPEGTTWTVQTEGNTCIRAFTLKDTAAGIAPKISSNSLPDGVLDVAYNAQISAAGSRPLTWSVSAGELPTGIELSSTGLLSGTPTEKGEFTFTITIQNSTNETDSKEFTINIIDQPEILTTEITGYLGYYLSEKIELSNGSASSWSITSGTLPKGLSFSTSTGTVSGKPTKKTSATITFKAFSTSWEVSKNIVITIEPKPVKPKVSGSKLKDGEIGESYSATLKTSGTTPISLSAKGLPSGLSMTSDGEVSGTPTVAGTFTVQITASNIFTQLNSTTITKDVKLKIKAKPPVFNEISGDLPMAIVSQKFDGYTFTLSQGTEPITWSGSSLPKGLTINSNGELTGTPTKAGNFKMNIKAKNDGGNSSKKVPITVYEIPTITTEKISEATTGKKYTAKFAAKGSTEISWDIEGLPDTLALTINKKGTQAVISGIPTSADSYELLLKASNIAGTSDEKKFTLTVKGVVPKIKASLARASVESEYTGSKISATGTFPIEFSYSISDTDKTKFGISSLEDIGLSFTSNPAAGTAEITGTPNQSVKNLPIILTATNVAGTATKKINFTAKGSKPAFDSSTPLTLKQTPGSAVNIDLTVTGSKKITFSMGNVSGFKLTQNDDYSATVTGTAPSQDGKKIKIKITAANPDGKGTKNITIQAASDTSDDNSAPQDYAAEENQEKQEQESESESESKSETKIQSGVVNFGSERSIKSLGSKELDALQGYTVAAVMPELTVTESNMYDFEIDLEPEIEADKELFYFAFAQNREKNSDDEIAEFFDIDGNEITKTTDKHKILISVWLNSGDIYAPVIAVKD